MIHQLNIIKNQKRIQKKFVKGNKIFLMKKKKKSGNMNVTDTKIFLSMISKGQLSVEKNIIKYGKIKPLYK